MADIAVPSLATVTPTVADTVVGVQGGAVKRFSVARLSPYLKPASSTQSAIQAAVDEATANYLAGSGSTEVYVPAGAYSFSGLAMKSGVRLILSDKAIITKTGSGVAAIGFDGTTSTSSNLTSNVAATATTIPVASGAAFAAGDVVMLMENTYLSGSIEVYRKRVMRRVVSVASNNVTIDRPPRRAFTTAATGRLVKLSPIKQARLEGGQFVVNSNSAIQLNYAADCVVEGIEASAFTIYGGIYVAYSLGIDLNDNFLRDGVNGDGSGYSIQVAGGSSLVNVRRTKQKKVRELPIGSYSQDVTVDGVECISSYDSTVNTHGQNCMDVEFKHIRSYNPQQYGVAIGYASHLAGDYNITLKDFEIHNAAANALIIEAPDGLRSEGVHIKDGKIFSGGATSEPVYMDQVDDIEINGVVVDGQGSGSGAGRMMLLQRLTDFTLQNNRLKNFAAGPYGFDMRDITGGLITGNYAQMADTANAFWLWEVDVGSGATVNSNCNVTGNTRIGGAQVLAATGTGGLKNTSNSWN